MVHPLLVRAGIARLLREPGLARARQPSAEGPGVQALGVNGSTLTVRSWH